MKFGKLLVQTSKELPELQFLRFKELKKQLKHMAPEEAIGDIDTARSGEGSAAAAENSSAAVQDELQRRTESLDAAVPSGLREGMLCELDPAEKTFIETLNEDVAQLNIWFIEKEEEVIIRLQDLQDQTKTATRQEELASLQAKFVDLHGELVLLMHWSLLNYAALVKILKKHDKALAKGGDARGRVPLKSSYLHNALQQPFYSTESITKLVRTVEQRIVMLTERQGVSSTQKVDDDTAGPVLSDALMLKRTEAALGMWQELGSNASTPSTVLPVAKRAKLNPPAASAAPMAANDGLVEAKG